MATVSTLITHRENLQRRLAGLDGLLSRVQPIRAPRFCNILTYASRAEGHAPYIAHLQALANPSLLQLESLIVAEFRCCYNFGYGTDATFKIPKAPPADAAESLYYFRERIGALYF